MFRREIFQAVRSVRARSLHSSPVGCARVDPRARLYQEFAAQARNPSSPLRRSPYLKYVGGAALVGGGVYYVTHLEHVEITGRTRFMNVGPAGEAAASKQGYAEIMQQFGRNVLPDSHPDVKFVKRVTGRLIRATGLKELDWEVHVIQSDMVNAFVIPGGKIFVFSGILPVAKDEDGLATVLGHEIGHQVARHVAEKMSFGPILSLVNIVVIYGLATVGLDINAAAWLGGNLTTLALDNPYSRHMETEADYIGLLLMAQACFDPHKSVGVWERMSQAAQGAPPQFLSTHPSNENRILKLKGWMSEAEQVKEKSDCRQQLQGFMNKVREQQSFAKY
ncbi:metalloendopeptidase [Savitreella phatthalungensis]